MVLPVFSRPATGYTTYDSQRNFIAHDSRWDRYVQTRPCNLVLPYGRTFATQRIRYMIDDLSYYGSAFRPEHFTQAGIDDTLLARLRSEAYGRVKAKAYSDVSAGMAILEGRQTISMVSSSASTLLRAMREVRRGNFSGAARILRTKVPGRVSPSKKFADNWLEYQFGWVPFLGDIYDGLEVFSSPTQFYQRCLGRSSDGGRIFSSDTGGQTVRNWRVDYSVGLQVVAIRDKVSFTLEQYGLNNPAVLAWESVPYSFVVDWFTNVGDVLASYTAFSGLEIQGAYHSYLHKCSGFGANLGTDPARELRYSGSGGSTQRFQGLPGLSFGLKSFKQPSYGRIATIISLILQQMKS